MLIKKENIPTPNPRGWSLILLGWQNWEEVAVLQANKQFTVGESLLPVLFSEAPLVLAEPSQLPNCTSVPLNTDLYLTLTVHKHEGFQRWKGRAEHSSRLKWKQGSKRWNPHPRQPRKVKSKEEITSLVQREFLRAFWKPCCYAQVEHKGQVQ